MVVAAEKSLMFDCRRKHHAKPFQWDFLSLAIPKTGLVDFPGGRVDRNPSANAGNTGLIPELERSPVVRNGNPLQCTCLGNSMGRGTWWATVHGDAKSQP